MGSNYKNFSSTFCAEKISVQQVSVCAPKMHSQDRQQNDPQSTRSWKQSAQGWGPSLRKAEAWIHQYADLQFRVLGESLQEHKEKVNVSSDVPLLVIPSTQNQHIGQETVYVGVNEGSDSYGIRFYSDLGSLQEHELRRASEFVRHHPEGEILNVKMTECASLSWTRSSLAHDQAIKWSKAKVRVYSDSVLCLGKWRILQMHIEDEKVKWKNFNKLILTENYVEMMENRLCSSGIFSQDLRHWKSILRKERLERAKHWTRKFWRSNHLHVDVQRYWLGEKIKSGTMYFNCNSEQVKNCAKNFTQGHWTFLGLGSEKKWYGKSNDHPEGIWQDTANMMVGQF